MTTLSVDQYQFNLSARKLLFEQLFTSADSERLKIAVVTGYEMWKRLFDSLYNSGEYFNELLLTDNQDFVVHYLSLNDNIVTLLRATVNKVKWINSEWVKDESQQITRYNLYFTEIYLLCCALKVQKTVDPQILEIIRELTVQQEFEVRYGTDKSAVLEEIQTYFK